MFEFISKLFGGKKKPERVIVRRCFFEKDRTCDNLCRAFSEKKTCTIVDRLKEKADANECAHLLKTLCRIDCDPEKIAKEFPELVPPPKLVYED